MTLKTSSSLHLNAPRQANSLISSDRPLTGPESSQSHVRTQQIYPPNPISLPTTTKERFHGQPPFSWPALIGQAIIDQRRDLEGICEYIVDSYSYFDTATRSWSS
jgi:hypothetical protein